jgi:hypothetical protein
MKFFNVTNHDLTDEQRRAVEQAGLEVVNLPEDLKARWSSVPPDADNETLLALVCDVATFIKAHDLGLYNIAMVQGEPVVCHNLAEFVRFPRATKGMHVIPVVATTRRESVEEAQPDGSVRKTAVFKHVGFRPYHLQQRGLLDVVLKGVYK